MTAVKLHIDTLDFEGHRIRRTYLIRERPRGEVDIVDARGPLLDADRSVRVIDAPDLELEVEAAG